MKDCKECANAIKSYGQWLCKATNTVRPANTVRDPRSECGPDAVLFEPARGVGPYQEADE